MRQRQRQQRAAAQHHALRHGLALDQIHRRVAGGARHAQRRRLVEDLGRSGGQAQERTVDVQITRLRRKIEADPKQPRYLQTVRGAGYMLAPD